MEVNQLLSSPRCGPEVDRATNQNQGINKKMELLGQESSFPFFFLEVNESFLPATLEMGGEPDTATDPPYGAESGAVTKKSH